MMYAWPTEGWLYLAVIIDLFSRRVVGWSMAEHMRTEADVLERPAIGLDSFRCRFGTAHTLDDRISFPSSV
jgi:transposase InsO family protein